MPNLLWINDKIVVNLDMVTHAKIVENVPKRVVLHLQGATPELSRFTLNGDEATYLTELCT